MLLFHSTFSQLSGVSFFLYSTPAVKFSKCKTETIGKLNKIVTLATYNVHNLTLTRSFQGKKKYLYVLSKKCKVLKQRPTATAARARCPSTGSEDKGLSTAVWMAIRFPQPSS